jgi:transposase-like protein
MVAAARRGIALREVARRFGVALATVRLWVARAEGSRLDRVDFAARAPGRPRPVNRSPQELEDLVLTLRVELKGRSDLGEFGARAIHDALRAKGLAPLPSARTIGRILERRGALDGRKRTRRPAPPAGWYLPDLAARRAELDTSDIVEGLVIKGGTHVEVLNATSLHGGLVASWPMDVVTAKSAVEALVGHWRAVGLPAYAQFDNDTIFQGPHQHKDVVGRVARLCLGLGIVPVFAPPREPGFQAAIENYNGRWQAKVWARFTHESLEGLRAQSGRYVTASRLRAAARIEAAPGRRPFPEVWALDLQAAPRGRIIYLRRTGAAGGVELLGRHFEVDATWPHRLVRAEVDLDAGQIRFYALRRRDPAHQPLLREVAYKLPRRRFQE